MVSFGCVDLQRGSDRATHQGDEPLTHRGKAQRRKVRYQGKKKNFLIFHRGNVGWNWAPVFMRLFRTWWLLRFGAACVAGKIKSRFTREPYPFLFCHFGRRTNLRKLSRARLSVSPSMMRGATETNLNKNKHFYCFILMGFFSLLVAPCPSLCFFLFLWSSRVKVSCSRATVFFVVATKKGDWHINLDNLYDSVWHCSLSFTDTHVKKHIEMLEIGVFVG